MYRKLAAALHPDREPEAQERERKTELMQRANVAYNKRDLLQLLELQLEIEQIDPSHINAISDNHLQHYIKILKEQCRDLEQAIVESLFAFGPEVAYSNFSRLSPKKVISQMEEELEELRGSLEAIQSDLPLFQDFTFLKDMLRDYRITSVEPNFDEILDMALADVLFEFGEDEFFDMPKTKKPKKKKTKKTAKRKKAAPRTV